MSSLAQARIALRARQGVGARYDDPAAPAETLGWARLGTAYFARLLNDLADRDLDAASRVPGWSRRHVVAQVGYQARALTRLTRWAATGEPEPIYASASARLAEVENGATLPARALRGLFRHAAVHLDVEWRDLPARAWDAGVSLLDGRRIAARDTGWMRAREIWLRSVDLDSGGSFLDMPPALVDQLLADAMAAWDGPPLTLNPLDRAQTFAAGTDGVEVDREAPFFFMKDAASLVASDATTPYPPGTQNYHHEMELVVALGAPVFRATAADAQAAIWGYGCGLDMTRRDLQLAARGKQRPWDVGKNFEQSAVVTSLVPAPSIGTVGPQRIWLSVNGEVRQDAHLRDMIWSPVELIQYLSGLYHLRPGDLIFTGTPAGVGAVRPGDVIRGGIDGLPEVGLTVGPAE